MMLRVNEASSAGESHPHALTDPDVNLSIHPARAIQLPGLALQLRLTLAIPSSRLITLISQDDPTPWLRPHCDTQGLHSYYG